MQMQAMEASINNELQEGEELLWSGHPDLQRRRIISPGRVFLILGLIFLPIGLLAIAIGLILLFSAVIPPASQDGLLGLFIPGGVFSLLGRIYLIIGLVGFSPSRNALYAITNRRVIVVRFGRYTLASSYDRKAITQIHRVERPDGSGDLIFSGNPYGIYSNNRSNTSNTYRNSRQGAFYALSNVRLVEQKLLLMLNDN